MTRRKERQFIYSERNRYIYFNNRLLLSPNEIILLIDITLTNLFWATECCFGSFLKKKKSLVNDFEKILFLINTINQ